MTSTEEARLASEKAVTYAIEWANRDDHARALGYRQTGHLLASVGRRLVDDKRSHYHEAAALHFATFQLGKAEACIGAAPAKPPAEVREEAAHATAAVEKWAIRDERDRVKGYRRLATHLRAVGDLLRERAMAPRVEWHSLHFAARNLHSAAGAVQAAIDVAREIREIEGGDDETT